MCESLGGLLDSVIFNRRIQRTAESGLSFEAVDTSAGDKRVGVFLCTTNEKDVEHPIDIESKSLFASIDEKTAKLSMILKTLYPVVKAEVYEKLGKKVYFEGVFLSVLSEYGGRGIAGKLIEAIEKKAQQMEIDTVYICCSSEFSAKSCEKSDFQLFHEYPYSNFVEDGEIIFKVKPPHYALKSYLKTVNWEVELLGFVEWIAY